MAKKKKRESVTGTISTTRGGAGFLDKEGLRIEPGDLNTALNKDTVEVQVKSKNRGRVTRVLKRFKTHFVGVVEKERDTYFLVPDDKKAYVDLLITNPSGLVSGQKALVRLTSWKNNEEAPRAEVVRVLGRKGEHEVEIESIVLEHNIDTSFPEDVKNEAIKLKQDWDNGGAQYILRSIERGERKDFRDIMTFTIDPRDAKDFDDALSVRNLPGGNIEVGVHVADVSHYIKPNSLLDKEASKKGFSIYLVDRTIPMLPEELSNDLCSLNPNVDRLTFSAVFKIDRSGLLKQRWFGKGVIHSDKRFSYEKAQQALNSKVPHKELTEINGLAEKLREKRFREGAIDFEQDEIGVEIDAHGTPIRIYKKERLDTHKLIEEFMLLANREVANIIYTAHGSKDIERGFIYRVHDLPDREKLGEISYMAEALGYRFGERGQKITARDINDLFSRVEGSAVETLIKTAMIRAMAKAAYTTKNIGHFGLGFKFYTHFTSPIRRYSDLLVHRVLAEHLQGRDIPPGKTAHYKDLARQLSEKEIAAQGAERESVRYKQIEYMSARIGRVLDGIITGVTEWGVYVADIETGTEGLVKMKDIKDDFYTFNPKRYRIVGDKTKKAYTLGDKVKVKISAVNVDRKTIDLVFV